MSSPADSSIDLDQVAIEADVHYQTAYRWVRSGKLPAAMVDGRYQVRRQDLQELLDARKTPAPLRPPSTQRLDRIAEKMHTALVSGDEASARDLAQTAIAEQTPVADLIQQVLVPPLRQIGQDWYDGKLSIWVEHRASAITERILGEIAPRPRGRRRGDVMVAAVSGDRHALATSMAAVTLRANNWRVHHLGADMPPDELVEFCEEHDIDVAVLTLANSECVELAHATSERIEALGTPTVVGAPGRTLEDLLDEVRRATQRH